MKREQRERVMSEGKMKSGRIIIDCLVDFEWQYDKIIDDLTEYVGNNYKDVWVDDAKELKEEENGYYKN